VIAGVGFIAAGGIIKQSNEQDVSGVTTAAGMWLTAAVGMAAGLGWETSAVLGTLLGLFVLAVLHRSDNWLKAK